MSDLLVWLSSLAASLLLLSLVTALAAPRRRGAALARLVFAVILLPAVGVTALAAGLWFAGFRPNLLMPTASWTLLFAIGGVWLLRRGLARPDAGSPAADAWPRGRLALATLAASTALGLVFEHLDATSQRRLADVAAGHRANIASQDAGPVPDHENAALALGEAFEELDSLSGLPEWFRQCGAPCTPDAATPEELERLARVSQPALRLLRRAAALPRYRHGGPDYVHPFRTRFPSLLACRRSANLLAFDAVQRSRQGDTATAAADIVATWRLAGHLASSGHALIEYLIAAAIHGIGTDALEDALAAGSWRAEELAALAAAQPPSFRGAFLRGLRTEESTFVLLVLNLEDAVTSAGVRLDDQWRLIGKLPVLSSLYRIYFVPQDLRFYGEWIARSQDLLDRDAGTGKDWEALEKAAASSPKGPLVSIALPSLLRARRSAVEADARARLARLAVATTAYQVTNGKLPGTLDDLAPEFIPALPVDPFDRKPLKMAAADGGLVLYSVGWDGIDGGGVERGRGVGDADLTFCLGPAYAARGRGTSAAGKAPSRQTAPSRK
jgi:hypothetical protein